jgi:hypothetical protein
MKKALLLLVFLLCYTTYGQQPPGLLDPYNICDDGTIDGYATFNLVSTDPIGMLGLDPNSYTVTFHPSVGDANDNVNAIANPTAYINAVPNYQTIGIRFLNTLTSEVNTSGMELNVFAPTTPVFMSSVTICSGDNAPVLPTSSLNGITGTWSPPLMTNVTSVYTFTPDPGQCATNATLIVYVAPPAIAYQGSLSFCNPLELPLYDLTTANTQITGGNPNNSVSYFLTLSDAQSNSNPIINSYTPTVIPGNQTLYARVTNFSGCFSITTLTLHTLNCNAACLAPTQVTTSSVTATSAMFSWSENGMATAWHVLVLPSGAPAPAPTAIGWVSASTNPFTITGLVSAASYDVYVRSVCNNTTFSEWSNATAFGTPNFTGCGGAFVDQGGSTANYPNNSNYSTTICPSAPGDAVSVTFLSFNTEVFADALYVYDGTSIAAPMIPSTNPSLFLPGSQPGGYWGNTIPGPFTASNITGCLTFQFLSDGTNTSEGWIANVDCIPQTCSAPTNFVIVNITDTTATLSWTNVNPSLENIAEIELTTNGISTSYYTSDLTSSLTVTLLPNQCYSAKVRTSCPAIMGTGMSTWSYPLAFCQVNCENSGNCANNLVLNAFLDSNNNGEKEPDEINFPYGQFVYQMNDSGNNLYGYANNGLYYIFDANPTNSYDISFPLVANLNPYYSCTTTYNNITLPTGSGTNTLYFPITNTQPYLDAQCSIYPCLLYTTDAADDYMPV